jgi:uncharacterized protein YdaU (DUF1376 family)
MKEYGFLFNVNDFLGSKYVSLMTASEAGAYFLLLCHSFPNGLENDDEMNRRLSRLTPDEWDKFRWVYDKKFILQNSGKLHNPRLLQDIQRSQYLSEKAIKANAVRWHGDSDNDATGLRPDSDRTPTTDTTGVAKEQLRVVKSSKETTTTKECAIKFNYETKEWDNISEKDVATWEKKFPGVDLETELYRAGVWLEEHPDRKIIRYKQFVTNWLINNRDKYGKPDTSRGPDYDENSAAALGYKEVIIPDDEK